MIKWLKKTAGLIAMCTAMVSAGCASIQLEDVSTYNRVKNSEQTWSMDRFEGGYLHIDAPDQGAKVLAVLFDFREDGYTLDFPKGREKDGGRWLKIRDNEHLQIAAQEVDDLVYQAITLKPCWTCPRIAVGMGYSKTPLNLVLTPDTGIITLEKSVEVVKEKG